MDFDVLIVDDDKMVLFIQDKMIQMSGFSKSPYKYEEASQALEYFKNSEGKPNEVVVFLDINMPYVSGWEFLEELKKQNIQQKVHVVMVTSSIDLKDKETAFEYENVVDYMIKPVTIENLQKLKSNPNLKHLF
jgi:response regulator of citrate/malate metabolism